jgi:hypothetical protein
MARFSESCVSETSANYQDVVSSYYASERIINRLVECVSTTSQCCSRRIYDLRLWPRELIKTVAGSKHQSIYEITVIFAGLNNEWINVRPKIFGRLPPRVAELNSDLGIFAVFGVVIKAGIKGANPSALGHNLSFAQSSRRTFSSSSSAFGSFLLSLSRIS